MFNTRQHDTQDDHTHEEEHEHEHDGDIIVGHVHPRYAAFSEGSDAPTSFSTPYTISAGDNFTGSLSTSDLSDVIGLNVTAGTSYTINLYGGLSGEISDPAMFVFDSSGNQIGFNDDSTPGSTLNSQITFTANTTGTYFIEATTFANLSSNTTDSDSGFYYLTAAGGVTPPPGGGSVGTFEEMAFYLTDTNWNETGEIRHTFSDHTITVSISGLTAAGQQLALWAFEAWEMIADVDFVVTNGSADLVFDDNDSGAYSAYTSDTNGNTLTSNINVSTNWLATYGTDLDSYSFSTYIHEIGHALGLGHQGPYNGSANYPTDATFLNDSEQLSIMSYFPNNVNTTVDASTVPLLTGQMVDIIAIQDLYGAASGGVTAGNTTYGANSNLGNYLDLFFDTLETGSGNASHSGQNSSFTIFDEGGVDTLNLSTNNSNNNINLNGGTFSDVGGSIGNVGIAVGTVIENVQTGGGNDSIITNSADNSITTGSGNDTVSYVGGTDTFNGAAGNDLVTFDISSADVTDVTLNGTTATITTGAGTLTTQLFENFEFTNETLNLSQLGELGSGPSVPGIVVNGTSGADVVLYGTDGDDTVSGRAGNDVIEGLEGNDEITGGVGADSISGGIGNDLIFGSGGNDDINGNAGNDTIYGNNSFDILRGSDGNDLLVGGLGFDTLTGGNGNDTLNGQSGFDVLYGDAGNDLLNGNAGQDVLHGGGNNDTLNGGINHDILYGDAGNDQLNGNNGIDTLYGGNGDDILFGNAGNDSLFGGAGNDLLNGGLARDTFYFNLGNDTVTDFSNNFDTIALDDALFGGATNVQAAVDMFTIVGGNLVADFGGGNTLQINGITNADALLDDLIFY